MKILFLLFLSSTILMFPFKAECQSAVKTSMKIKANIVPANSFSANLELHCYKYSKELAEVFYQTSGERVEVYQSSKTGQVAYKELLVDQFIVFDNVSEYHSFVDELHLRSNIVSSPLYGLIGDAKFFNNFEDENLLILSELLIIDKQILDFSSKSLSIVSSRLNAMRNESGSISYLLSNKKELRAIIFYVGRMYYENTSSDINMSYDHRLKTYLPLSGETNHTSAQYWVNLVLDFLSDDSPFDEINQFIYKG